MSASNTNLLHSQVEGEIKAELAKIEQSMRNLIDAVKQGALSMEQIREENGGLQDAKRRLEKRLQDLQDRTRVAEELSAVLETFDHNLHSVLTDLMQNRLRFNTFVRICFSALMAEVDRPGPGWRKGKKRGELPDCHARIKKYALQPQFAAFVDQSGIKLPNALEKAERYSWNRSESHGSPLMW